MSSTQKPSDAQRSLPDDIALAAGLPHNHQAGASHHDTSSPGTYTASTHTAGTQTHSIQTEAGATASSLADEAKSKVAEAHSKAGDLKDRAADIAQDARARVTDTVQDARERVSDTVQDLRARASDAYDDARSWVSDTHQSSRRRIGDLGERGGARLQDGRSAAEDFVAENPLLVGVVGLAAGLLIGALLPRTRTEDRNVGPWADEVRGQGLRYARDFTDRSREFVASALDPENLNAVVQRASETGQPNPAPQPEGPRPH